MVGHLQGFIYSLTLQAKWLVFPLWVEKGGQGSPSWGLEDTGLAHSLSQDVISLPIMGSLTLILLIFLMKNNKCKIEYLQLNNAQSED